jgi:hypothetical protein
MVKWRDNRKNANRTTNKVPLYTLELLREMGIHVKAQEKNKKKYIFCIQGYDFLENFFVVRHYVCEKNKISLRVLEMLLKLFPMNYFTYKDYYELPKNFQLIRPDYLINKGLMQEIKVNDQVRAESVFKLTTVAGNIVKDFYKYLSGEKKIPEERKYNHMADPKASTIDKLRYEFIKKMNRTEPSETKKQTFKD